MAKSKPRNKNVPRPPRPVIPMKPKPNGDKKKTPRPTIPMKPKPKSALEELEKNFGPVKYAEPDTNPPKKKNPPPAGESVVADILLRRGKYAKPTDKTSTKKPKNPPMQPNGVWTILGTK